MPKRHTASGKPPAENYEGPAPQPIDPETEQHKDHYVLSPEERLNNHIRPYRDVYRHRVCMVETTMGRAIAETYSVNPKFYTSTFCIKCRKYLPLNEFEWLDGEEVGS